MIPHRVQLSRRKGWRMPPDTVKVTRPGRYGNPFKADWPEGGKDAGWAVAAFRGWLAEHPWDLTELRGKHLACWCRLCPAHAAGKPLGTVCEDCAPCHADVLLKIANARLDGGGRAVMCSVPVEPGQEAEAAGAAALLRAGWCQRRKGHGTAGGIVWKIAVDVGGGV